jgi:integrase
VTTGTTTKKCGCRHPVTGTRYNQKCPQLRDRSGRWSRTHGTWHFQIELPPTAAGTRRVLRHGPYTTQDDADNVLTAIRAALAVPDPDDTAARARVGDLIAGAIKAEESIPEPDKVRVLLKLDLTPQELPTVGVYLDRWLPTRKKLKRGTRRSYANHIQLHLTPHLGHHRIDKLRATHISAMFDDIADRNYLVAECRASRDQKTRDKVKGMRHVGPASMHRIRATLRKALNDAIRVDRYITINEAALVELPPERAPKPLVWTAARVKEWKDTGEIPSKVMVWTPVQTGEFLDHVEAAEDHLYALYHLITYTGLRRGEACGVRWTDIDLDENTLTVRWQIVQHGWVAEGDTPKTDDSADVIALDDATVAVLRAHHTRQLRERLAAGSAWIHTGYAFTTKTGGPLHPAAVTDHFQFLTAQSGLPPIRLHDLRHGNATLALAAGVPMKIISANMRHSSTAFTDARYAHILDELRHDAAAKTAAVVPRRNRKAPLAS